MSPRHFLKRAGESIAAYGAQCEKERSDVLTEAWDASKWSWIDSKKSELIERGMDPELAIQVAVGEHALISDLATAEL